MALLESLYKNLDPEEYKRAQISAIMFDIHAQKWWLEHAQSISEREFLAIRKEVNQ